MLFDVGVYSMPQPLSFGTTSALEAVAVTSHPPLVFAVGALNCFFVDTVFAT